MVRIDSDSSWLRLIDQAQWVKEKDARILRLLRWLLGNWGVGSQLTFEHVPRLKNEVADTLSRWMRQESVEEEESLNMLLTDQIVRNVHRGHYGLRKAWRRCQQINPEISYEDIKNT